MSSQRSDEAHRQARAATNARYDAGRPGPVPLRLNDWEAPWLSRQQQPGEGRGTTVKRLAGFPRTRAEAEAGRRRVAITVRERPDVPAPTDGECVVQLMATGEWVVARYDHSERWLLSNNSQLDSVGRDDVAMWVPLAEVFAA